MEEIFSLIPLPFLQLLLALILGGVLGFEREMRGKEAGLRTYALVCVGAAFFTIIANSAFFDVADIEGARLDLGNVIAAIAVGLGFLGAGLIWRTENQTVGLTSAAGIWVTGAIGSAVGLGLYGPAVFAVVLVLFTFWIVGLFEIKLLHRRGDRN